MCGKAGVKFAGDVEAVARELEGQKVSGRVVCPPRCSRSSTRTAPRIPFNNAEPGEGLVRGRRFRGAATEGGPAKPKAAQAEPKKAPKAPPPPADDDDDDEEEEAPGQKSKSGRPVQTPPPTTTRTTTDSRLVLARTHAPDVIADFQRGKSQKVVT